MGKLNMINFKIKLFTLLIITSNNFINADDKAVYLSEAIENKMVQSPIIINGRSEDIMLPIKVTNKEPLEGVNFDLTRIFNKSNKVIGMLDLNLEQDPRFKEKTDLTLKPGEYIHIRGNDRKLLLFNGSFIVQFRVLPDLANFALANELEYVTSLSDINMGVFKLSNLINLESKLKLLQDDDNVISINLDTIDPSIKPR
tara:strand:+ start:16 stop:612 length:597 start_codon:yes stop_codon:yes gene_type:complete